MKQYFVARLENKADGTASCPVTGYEDYTSAQEEFFRVCGAAVDSSHPVDSVMLVDYTGNVLKAETFDHRE